MIYLNLIFTFFKIGLFSFGGGYGMIPLIEREIISRGWLTDQEFVNIISISEMTPGPIAINIATFVGYKTGGIPGGLLATTGVVLPSLILILVVSYYLSKYGHSPILKETIYWIRPVVLALIIQAAIFVAGNTFFKEDFAAINFLDAGFMGNLLENINFPAIIITVVSLAILLLAKMHPIPVILAAGSAGVILHYAGIL
ncbi:MAG: chromate transporter [Actinomycetota bacterium]|nr:chromate transporter [Actinomycetota bacterium]